MLRGGRRRVEESARLWWEALLQPAAAGQLVLGRTAPPGFTRRLALAVVLMYAVYGFCMGLFRGWFPALVSAGKLPFLYLLTLAICFPPLYALNCLLGPGLAPRQCVRLLLLATSANAVALASYSPFALFFTTTTSRDGYGFLVLMHVGVFAAAGLLSLVAIGMIFRGTAAALDRRLRLSFVAGWGLLYGFVGTQMSWALRPWIGSWSREYTPFREAEGSFVESVWGLIQNAL